MRFLAVLILVLSSRASCLCAQTAKTEILLKPEDLGIHKYVWEVTPQHEEIVVLYREEWLGGKQIYKQEILLGQEREGVLCTKELVVVDGALFSYFVQPGKPESYLLNYPGGGTRRIDNCRLESWRDSCLNGGPETLSFTSLDGPGLNSKLVYDVYVKSYSVPKERYPNLPAFEELRKGGWTANVPP